ncbi:MAG TPA: ATP-dependent DNA helicase RecG, partial [Chryseosolibacter sp.]
MPGFFDTPIEYLKGVGPQRAALLNKELKVFTYGDLIQHYPFRYEDRSRFYRVGEIREDMPAIQLKGKITGKELIGGGYKKRMVCYFQDGTGQIELVWF